jgi:hypothetical protein
MFLLLARFGINVEKSYNGNEWSTCNSSWVWNVEESYNDVLVYPALQG